MGSILHDTGPLLKKDPLLTPRRLRVVCVGAGYSGLLLAHRVKYEKGLDFIDLTVFEKNAGIGGTWYENTYPGAACDVPSHIYTFPFAPNPDWSSFYVSSPEILRYMQSVVQEFGLLQYVRLRSRVVSSIWSDEKGVWTITVEEESGRLFQTEAEVLVNGSGILNRPKMPAIPGLTEFEGAVVHSARWNHDLDYKDKRIAIIGNGSSAIQILPQLQRDSTSIVEYIRTPTWIISNFLSALTPEGKNFQYTEEQRKIFRETPEELRKMRRKLEHTFNQEFSLFFADSPMQDAVRKATIALMTESLQGDKELIEKLIPDFPVGCRRLTPGSGYLEALQQENVQACFDAIQCITEKGIKRLHRATDGTVIEVEDKFDIIICATGFDVSFSPAWNITGRNGASLKQLWASEAEAYLGIFAPQMPNYFIYNGPNCPIGHGSLIACMDATTDLIVRVCKKIATNDIKSIHVKSEVIREYNDYAQEVLKGTVWAGKCRSWYKNNQAEGRVTAMYPGSVPHYRQMLQMLRFEDFEYTYRSANRFRFMGSGVTRAEVDGEDLADYLEH